MQAHTIWRHYLCEVSNCRNFAEFIARERERLHREREEIFNQQQDLENKLAAINREMQAIDAYESAYTNPL